MRRFPFRAAAALVLLCVWHICLRRSTMRLPLILDEGEYSFVARTWSAGGLPYRDAYSPKPPMVFLAYRLAYAFSDRPEAPRLWFAAFSLATMLLLLGATPDSWSWPARLAPAAAFAALSAYPSGSLGFAANTELLVAFFMTLAAFAAVRSWRQTGGNAWPGLAGLSCGAALMSKPTCAWSVLALAFFVAWGAGARGSRRLGRFALSAALVPAGFLLYFAARGGLAAFWDDALRRNMDYARATMDAAALRPQLSWLFGDLAPLFLKGGWLHASVAAIGIVGVSADRPHRFATLVVSWLGTALAGLMMGFFFFPHYFLQAMAPLSLACGLGVERAVGRRPALGLGLAALLAFYPALVFARLYFADPPPALAKELLYPNPLYEVYPVAGHIREHSAPSDTMYVFGSQPQLYVYAERRPATEHIITDPLTMYPRGPDVERELVKLEQAPPKFLVYCTQPAATLIFSRLGESFRDGVRGLLARRYRFVGASSVAPDLSKPPRLDTTGDPDWDAPSSLLLFERR